VGYKYDVPMEQIVGNDALIVPLKWFSQADNENKRRLFSYYIFSLTGKIILLIFVFGHLISKSTE
jgi:hypothetical protein